MTYLRLEWHADDQNVEDGLMTVSLLVVGV